MNMKPSRRDQNLERFRVELSYIRAFQILQFAGSLQRPENFVSEKVFGRVSKFLDVALKNFDVYPNIGVDNEGGFNVEWYLSKRFCSTFYENSVHLEIFNQSICNVNFKIKESSDENKTIKSVIFLFQKWKDLLEGP